VRSFVRVEKIPGFSANVTSFSASLAGEISPRAGGPGPVANCFPSSAVTAQHSVRLLNPLQDKLWDTRLASQGIGSFFQGAAWARVLEATYGYKPNYFAAFSGERLNALLPIMEVDSWLTGRRGISLPFTDYCDPLVGDIATFQAVLERAEAHGRERKWKYLELRAGTPFLHSALPSQRFYGHEIALVEDDKRMFGALAPSVRRAIRKAGKQGLAVEISADARGVREFYALQCRTRRKHGLPPQPFKFFQNLQSWILSEGRGIIMLARLGARAVAGSIFLHIGQQAIYKFGASDETMLELRGNDMIMWEGMKYFAAKGFRTLHLGRTSLANHGLRRFKLGWGAHEFMIDYFKYDLRRNEFVRDRDNALGWHNRIFAALPLSLSRLLGSVLYRHVA
jgi:hypothetical protein